MKTYLAVIALLISSSATCFADDMVPLYVSKIVQAFGCGVQPPNGGTCPVDTAITITMPVKPGCLKASNFTVQVVQNVNEQDVTIFRKIADCVETSYPQQFDSVDLSTEDLLLNKPIILMNPLSTVQLPRP